MAKSQRPAGVVRQEAGTIGVREGDEAGVEAAQPGQSRTVKRRKCRGSGRGRPRGGRMTWERSADREEKGEKENGGAKGEGMCVEAIGLGTEEGKAERGARKAERGAEAPASRDIPVRDAAFFSLAWKSSSWPAEFGGRGLRGAGLGLMLAALAKYAGHIVGRPSVSRKPDEVGFHFGELLADFQGFTANLTACW